MQPDQYLARTDDWYVVADNRSYEFYVEEFRTLTDALAWLNEC
jgi:translation elongation factor P/translation initiation factor 5A